jgi:TldD protein
VTRAALVLLGAASCAAAQAPNLLSILAVELQRNFRILSEKGDPQAYFMAYSVVEQETGRAAASMGALLQSGVQRSRTLDVSVRVGSHKLDNYRRVRGERPQFAQPIAISLDDAPAPIVQRLWWETDRAYRAASERFIRIKTDEQLKAAEDPSDDFSVEEAVRYSEPPGRLKFSLSDWESKVRKISRLFARHAHVTQSQVSVVAERQTKYFVNSEGTRVQHGRGFARITLTAGAVAPVDGMSFSLFETFDAEDVSRLPSDAVIEKAVEKLAADLDRLIQAPVVDPYVGPAILSGRAAGVFFHEIFGHRIEGHRQKDEAEGQTFTKSVGQKILPEFLSVIFDPTVRNAEGADLNGFYRYDDEGVPARRVPVVEDGVLKTFLMSRSPIQGFPKSNGHGRKAPGSEPVGRQSNLFVESKRQMPFSELRTMLIEEVRRQGKPYGLYFDTVTGGFTTTGRRGVQAFTVIPLIVYRVYPDGRPDELVRGVDIVGTPLASFEKILATSDRREVFNGVCGAESGLVPVSAVAPAILVGSIEVQRKPRTQDRPPILPRPVVPEEAP